jgi:hypothetical protein
MEQEFKRDIENLRVCSTPLPSGEVVIRPKEASELVEESLQKRFRSGVGMLLYLVKYSRPDIANGVRELSKVMDGATMAHVKSLFRLVKFIMSTKDKCLEMKFDQLQSGKKWKIKAFCDSDYAGDRDTRMSVTGFIIFVAGAPISWRSRGQKSVSLSSSEAEYIALSEVCGEILFLKQVLEFLGVDIDLPIQIMVDNIGAIFLSQNQSVSQRTRHIDVRHHFVRQHIENGVVEVNFVRSEENVADIFTKNVGTDVYNKHVSQFLGSVDASNRKGVENSG